MKINGVCTYGPQQTAFTGGALVAATGFDRAFSAPIYQRAVHWGLGGVSAPTLFHGGELFHREKEWGQLAQMFSMGVMGGASYYTTLYFFGRLLQKGGDLIGAGAR